MNQLNKILIIDDSPKALEPLRDGISALCLDANVFSATNGKDAIKIIDENKEDPFDLIICDHEMHPGNGVDVLDFITSSKIDSLFVLLTSYDNQALLKEIINKEYFKYIQKPINVHKLETVLNQAQEYLASTRKTQKLSSLGEVMSSLIHEINNPLGIILFQCQLLKASLLSEEENSTELNDELDSIYRNSEKINKLIKETRDLILNKETKKKPTEVNFKKLHKDLKEYIQSKPIDFPIDISFIDQDISNVSFDQDAMSQVFFNLINNSIDALSDHVMPKIYITGKNLADQVIIDIVDSGKINPDLKDKIFEKGFSQKKNNESSGLGLDICKKLLNHQGHKILLNTNYPTTCFTLIFKKENQ